ncbi:ABC-2 type transporter-domain-containing protein [Scenedesmus sp. NREL 46B-D3]|nr:ABC-2 type transporter-domain-containing protein [Scenedesmus sp. NREL 46B-D3]
MIVLLLLLACAVCRDTLVGDGGLMMRGTSGGERKRLTTAEMVVGPQRVLLMDEISTGLDSATLYSVISFFTAMSHALNLTTIVSLLQPPPEVFSMFDDLLLLANGKMLYHGPLEHAMRHFTQMGFTCPVRKDIPSFLLEITTPAGAQRSSRLCTTLLSRQQQQQQQQPAHMAAATLLLLPTPIGTAMVQQLSEPFDPLMSHPAALEKRRYALSPMQAIAVCTRRQVKLVLRDKVLLKGRMLQIIAVSLMVGSLFFRLTHGVSDARSFYGAAFMVILFMSMGSMPQIGMVMAQKGVSLKHRDSLLYPGYAHGAAMALSQLPVSVVEATLFSCIIYFMVGFHMKVTYFFIFWVVVVASNLCLTALFRLLAVLAPNPTLGAAYGGLALLILILTSGFAIVRGSIPLYWIWAYYLSPFAYALRALVINEFRSPQWTQRVLGVPGASTMGQAALISFDFYTDEIWIVIGIAFLFGAYVILSAATCLALDWVTGPQRVAHVPDAKQLELVREAAEQRRAEAQLQLLRRHQDAAAKATGMSRLSKATRRNSQAAGAATNGASDPGEVFSPRAVRINMDSGLDFTPITLVFQDLRWDAEPPPKELELLKGVSGHAVPGKLMALMGGSGAGKTTLMDVICGRKTVGRTTGHLLVNGLPIVKSSWSRVVGYVEQMDVHTPAQTVIEALWFSGRLRLSPKVSDQQVRAYVEQVIDIVDLTDLSFSIVGLPGGPGGLSTEQLKRLTIAVELVANPSVVFMDEPTSGLDARAAAIVMRAVRNVALSGRTVMVTIHQPSIEIFEAFDTLLLLQRGGRTTYFGPLGHESSQLISYLQSVPGTCPIAAGQNPATWMLEVTGGSMAMVSQPNSIDWPAVYVASSLAACNALECERLVQDGQASGMQLKMTSMYAQPFSIQVRELLLKYWLVYWRTPSYTLARCFLTLCVAFIYGSMYFKAGHLPKPYAAMGNVQNIMGIMFSSTNFLGMTNLMAVMPLVGMERVVFYRERGALPYDPFAYGMAIALVEIPYLLIQALLFVPVIYFMIGFEAQAEKCFFYFMMFLASISFYTIFGQFMVYVTPSQQIAQVVGAGLNFTMNLFNGFVIAYPAMPSYWRWLNRAVPTTWVLYGLGVSQLGDVTDQLVQFAGRRMPVSSFTKMLFDFDYDMRWWCLVIVFGYVVFFRVTSIWRSST